MNAHAPAPDDYGAVDWREPAFRRANPVFSEPYGVLRTMLRDARHAAGLSQRELAARIGKHPSHVAMIERGQRRIDALELYRMARVLDADPAGLLARIGEQLEALDAGEAAP